MISYIVGNIKLIGEKSACIMTQGGVGYDVYFSKNTLENINIDDKIETYIYTHVREDSFELYGFIDESDKKMFELLTSISGIGPKSAQAILATVAANNLYNNIVNKNIAYLNQIPGVGKKMAEKIILELKDKLPKTSFVFKSLSESVSNTHADAELVEVLKSMGYTTKEVTDAISRLPSDIVKLEDKIKHVLKGL